jgi:hypothetical protein
VEGARINYAHRMKSLLASAASFVLTASTVFVAVACSSSVDTLPPLGADPTGEELVRHASRYCTRLETCAPDQATTSCLGRMTEHDNTPEGRRSSARMWNAFSECMTMDCVGMSACFGAKTRQLGVDQAKQTGPQPTGPAPTPTTTPTPPIPPTPAPPT